MKKEMSGKVLSLTMVFVMVICGICGIGFNAFANDVISAELSIEHIGHIFTDKNVSVTATIKNTGASAENVKYTFSATDEDGDVVYSKSDSVSVASGESKEAVFSFTAPKYGFYNAELKINGATSAKTRFSVIRKSEALNNRIGMNTHYIAGKISGYYSNDEIAEFQKLVADAGFGQAREGVTWAHYEGAKDIYSLFPEHRNMLQAFENYGQNNLLILGHQNLARGIYFPTMTDELDAWRVYVEKLAEDVREYGVKDFELWNEVNSYYFTDSSGKRRTPTAAE